MKQRNGLQKTIESKPWYRDLDGLQLYRVLPSADYIQGVSLEHDVATLQNRKRGQSLEASKHDVISYLFILVRLVMPQKSDYVQLPVVCKYDTSKILYCENILGLGTLVQ